MGSQTLWRLESGRSSEVKKMVINALCDLYQASDEERSVLVWLAQESRKDGWWQSYKNEMVPDFEMFVGLEQAAARLISWQSTLLPGLLQTANYRRAVGETFNAQPRSIDIEREVGLVTQRQARLQDAEKFDLAVMLSEAALRYWIGSKQIMAEQLRHLAEIGKLPNVSIRVVPFPAGNHLGLSSKDFVLLEFPVHPNPALNESPVVYVEGFTGALYLDKPDEVEQYRAAWATIGAVALSEHGTRQLVLAIAKEYEA
jgi:hypothetical protein